jgi:hypothetical protein
MTKIRCTLPNASEEMNGIKFAVDAGGGVVSVDAVPAEMAEIFLSIPGFTAEVKTADEPLLKDAAKATKGAKATKETPAADADAKAPESTEGTESTKAAENGKPEGEV